MTDIQKGKYNPVLSPISDYSDFTYKYFSLTEENKKIRRKQNLIKDQN